MDERGYVRLQKEHLKVIEETKNRIGQWERFEKDYEILQERLVTLPRKLKHNVMVPITNLAFMPGHLYHTNEVLVLLGDNWFAERSASQAHEIVTRRMKFVKEELKKERQHLKDISTQHSLTSNIQNLDQDVVEIKEEFDPVKEKEKRKSHKERRRKDEKKEEIVTKEDNEATKYKTDDEIWARLDELEREEEREEEKLKKQSKPNLKQKIIKASKSENNERKNVLPAENIAETNLTNTRSSSSIIHFSHSQTGSCASDQTGSRTSDQTGSRTSDQTQTSSPKYVSPGDIMHNKTGTAQERKEERREERREEGREEERGERTKSVHWGQNEEIQITKPIPSKGKSSVPPPVAFTGKIIERQRSSLPANKDEGKTDKGEKKVSRFKASRSK